MTRINGDISDLFFNHDHGEIAVMEDGEFVEYDDNKLRASARDFIGYLERLNVAVPDVDELVADFYGRI